MVPRKIVFKRKHVFTGILFQCQVCIQEVYGIRQYLLCCTVEISVLWFPLGYLYYCTFQIAEPHLQMIAFEKIQACLAKSPKILPLPLLAKCPMILSLQKFLYSFPHGGFLVRPYKE